MKIECHQEKRFFQDLEDEGASISSKPFACEDINAETLVDPHKFQNEHIDTLDQLEIEIRVHQQITNYKITKRKMIFDHLEDEGTLVDRRIRNEKTSASRNTSEDNENAIDIHK